MTYFHKFILIVFVIFCLFFSCVILVGVDIDLSLDRSNWIDPNDPLSGKGPNRLLSSNFFSDEEKNSYKSCEQLAKENERLNRMYAALESSRENSVDVLLKHILFRFFSNLNIDLNSSENVYRKAIVYLLPENLHTIKRYLSSQKTTEEFGLREDLRFALEDFIIESNTESYLFSTLYSIVPYIVIINALVLPVAIWTVLRSLVSIRHFIILMLIVSFCISCYSTYARKYQEILAQRFERVEKNAANQCTPDSLLSEAYNALLSYVRIKGKSECLKHYEDILIEPIWLIDPLQVVAEVSSNFILTPFSVCGYHLNKFFNDFFINTPIQLMIVKCVFLLLLLFYLTGYRVRTIFATIEPARPMETISNHLRSSLTSSQNEFSQKNLALKSSKVTSIKNSTNLSNNLGLEIEKLNFHDSKRSVKRLSNTFFYPLQNEKNFNYQFSHKNFHQNFDDSNMDTSFDDSRITHRKPFLIDSMSYRRRSYSLGRFN